MINLPVTGMNGYETFDRSLCDLLIIFTECKGCDAYRKYDKIFFILCKKSFSARMRTLSISYRYCLNCEVLPLHLDSYFITRKKSSYTNNEVSFPCFLELFLPAASRRERGVITEEIRKSDRLRQRLSMPRKL